MALQRLLPALLVGLAVGTGGSGRLGRSCSGRTGCCCAAGPFGRRAEALGGWRR